jgi:hypothetical protein
MLLVGAGGNAGTGATALACWAAVDASNRGEADYVRLVTSLNLLSASGGEDEEARAATLVERFSDAGEMQDSLLVLDDVDQLCAGSGPGGYSSIMLATLKELLRSPPAGSNTAKVGEHSQTKQKNKGGQKRGKTLRILAATSRSDAACVTLHELFDETLVLKPLRPCISSKLPYACSSKPNTMTPCSILKKKGTPKASSPSEQQGDDESIRKLKRVNAKSSEDAFAKARLVIQNTEQEGSIRDLTPVLDIKKEVSMPGIKFADNVEVNEISRLRESAIDICFYTEIDLSKFRHEAFCESCGLDPSEFDS